MSYNYKPTVFKENGIGIDPEGCACTDCSVGYSFPANQPFYNDNLAQDIIQGRKLWNRTGERVRVEVENDEIQFIVDYDDSKFVVYLDKGH